MLNLAPYSFFNAFNHTPPIVGFARIGRKHSVRNAEATGGFVRNPVARPLAEDMNLSCAAAPPEVDEFALAGLTPAPSRRVQVPRVGESPVAFECCVRRALQSCDAAGHDVPIWLTFGEVVAMHIAKSLLRGGVYDTAAARPVLRGGGPADCFEPGERFSLRRPAWPR